MAYLFVFSESSNLLEIRELQCFYKRTTHRIKERRITKLSKEEYLKGDQKLAVLDLIRKYMAYRMTNEEILGNLQNNGYKISERTLRRYKLEIRQMAGKNFSEIYQNEIMTNIVEDVFTIRELQRQGWQEYNTSKSSNEKLKALTLIRNLTLDKLKLPKHVPLKFRLGKVLQNSYDILNNSGDDSQELKN